MSAVIALDYTKEYKHFIDLPIDIYYKGEGYEVDLGMEGSDNLKINFTKEQLERLQKEIKDILER